MSDPTLTPHLRALLRAMSEGKNIQMRSGSTWTNVGPITAMRFLVDDWMDGKDLEAWWRVGEHKE